MRTQTAIIIAVVAFIGFAISQTNATPTKPAFETGQDVSDWAVTENTERIVKLEGRVDVLEAKVETVSASAPAVDPSCPNGCCQTPAAVSAAAPYSSPPGYHRHVMEDGSIMEHEDNNIGDPVAHTGVVGIGWPKYYGPEAPGQVATFYGGCSGVSVSVQRNRVFNGIGPLRRLAAGLAAPFRAARAAAVNSQPVQVFTSQPRVHIQRSVSRSR